jgi:argininosuccinate lyase
MTRTITVIGNVQLDVLASPVSSLPSPGGDSIIDRIEVRTAGAAGNVSLALDTLGVPHRLVGAVGDDDAGRWIHSDLERRGLADDLLVVPDAATGISIAMEAPERERAFLTAHGVLTDYTLDDIPGDAHVADLLLLTGYFSLPALRREGTRQLLTRARESRSQIWFDTGWDPDDWQGEAVREVLDLLPLVDVFLPNEQEALALTRQSTAQNALAALKDRCPGWVVLKLGEAGLLAAGPDGTVVEVEAPLVDAIDTTGAGDSLAAGALSALAEGATMEAALRTGVRVASTVIGRSSHRRYPTPEELIPL